MPAESNTRLKRILALDWDAHTLRVVHALLSKRGFKIDRLLAAPIPREVDPDDPPALGLHIRRVLDQEGISTRHAIVDIPRDQATLKNLRLPRIRPEELAGVVHIQIAKELAFPAAEAVIDFVAEDDRKDREGPQDVLVAVVRRDVLDRYQKTFQVAGLKPCAAGLRPFAHKTALNELLKFSMPQRVLFIDVRPTLTEIDVLRDGILSFSRAASVTVAGVHGTVVGDDADDRPVLSLAGAPREPAAVDPSGGSVGGVTVPGRGGGVVSSLVMEVMTSLEAYRADDPGAEIDHVIVAGEVGIEQALADAIHQRLGVTAELYNPAVSLGWEPDEGAAAVSFASTLGHVQAYTGAEGGARFDFLHPKKMVSVTQERLRKAPLAAAALGLLLIAPVVGLERWSAPKRAALARIQAEIAELEETKKQRKEFLEFADTIRAFDSDQHVWVDVLHDVFEVLPNNEYLVITQIDLQQKDGRVTLKTKAIDRDTATRIVRAFDEFRRAGRATPRFKATVGPQSERKGERYAWWQDLRLTILDDSKGSRRGGGG